METEKPVSEQLGEKISDASALTEKANAALERLESNRRALDASRQRLESELSHYQGSVKKRKNPFNHLEHTDKSRKHIAFVFVYSYVILVAIITIGVPFYNYYIVGIKSALDLVKILSQVGALVGSPLGFVVGYYFKEDNKSQ